MSPKPKVMSEKVEGHQNQEVNEGHTAAAKEDEQSEKSPKLVDSGNESDRLINSDEEEVEDDENALKDSDSEDGGGGGLLHNIPIAAFAAAAHDEDVPERPPPNKKHRCLQVIIYIYSISKCLLHSIPKKRVTRFLSVQEGYSVSQPKWEGSQVL